MRKRIEVNPVVESVVDDWLAVSTEGFASMNAGREPAHLVKELVQNSLDAVGAGPGHIELTIKPGVLSDTVMVTCRDDGGGMTEPLDIRTVFLTTKTDSVRPVCSNLAA
jgi:two-component sensor histidine kinase